MNSRRGCPLCADRDDDWDEWDWEEAMLTDRRWTKMGTPTTPLGLTIVLFWTGVWLGIVAYTFASVCHGC